MIKIDQRDSPDTEMGRLAAEGDVDFMEAKPLACENRFLQVQFQRWERVLEVAAV